MKTKLDLLIEHATLDIMEFDIHCYPPRTVMNVVGRVPQYYIMSYLKLGLAQIRFRDQTYITPPGSVVILPPGEPHDHIRISDDPAVFLWWDFHFKIAGCIDLLKLVRMPLLFKLSDTDTFENLFCSYMELTREPVSIPRLIRRRARSLEVMAFLMEAGEQAGTSGDAISYDRDLPESFIDILLEILRSPSRGCNLGKLAERYHLHPTYLSNRFKEIFGIAPVELHRTMMLDRAKTLLKSEKMSVTEVATALGYEDLSSFTRFFTSRAGISPARFKAESLGKKGSSY